MTKHDHSANPHDAGHWHVMWGFYVDCYGLLLFFLFWNFATALLTIPRWRHIARGSCNNQILDRHCSTTLLCPHWILSTCVPFYVGGLYTFVLCVLLPRCPGKERRRGAC